LFPGLSNLDSNRESEHFCNHELNLIMNREIHDHLNCGIKTSAMTKL